MDFDPVPADAQFQGDTLLERVCRAYEEAVDAAGDAYDAEADAENVYLYERAVAWAHATEDGIAITARGKHVDCQTKVTKARQEWNRAIAKRNRCRDKVDEMGHRVTAAMSHQRFVREGT